MNQNNEIEELRAQNEQLRAQNQALIDDQNRPIKNQIMTVYLLIKKVP